MLTYLSTFSIESLKVREVNDSQPPKRDFCNIVTVLGIIIFFILLHPLNPLYKIRVTLLVSSIFVIDELSIFLTLFLLSASAS